MMAIIQSVTRYAAGHKDETRARILAAAGRLFRREGYVASGIAKLMSASGLTVGGFYAHFASKEELLSAVLERSLDQTRGALLAGLEDLEGSPFIREVARRYLSRLHRDAPEEGCALPSLATEVSRQSPETRRAFEEYLENLLAEVEDHLPVAGGLTRRDRAIALVALMVGGLVFARAVESKELSDRILMACKRFAVAEEKV
jgi:TetR/AcrR family transcriptional regulator, transcriptional repressor for nem operon